MPPQWVCYPPARYKIKGKGWKVWKVGRASQVPHPGGGLDAPNVWGNTRGGKVSGGQCSGVAVTVWGGWALLGLHPGVGVLHSIWEGKDAMGAVKISSCQGCRANTKGLLCGGRACMGLCKIVCPKQHGVNDVG